MSTASVNERMRTTRTSRRSSSRLLWLWILIGLIGILLITGVFFTFFTLFGGHTSGEEFSPDTFARRSFSYTKVPFFGGIWGKREVFDRRTNELVDHLINNKLIQPINLSNETWHLISDNRTAADSPDFDAQFLTRILELRNENGECVWLNWTFDHANCAKLLWPQVAELARKEMYLSIPDLMELAFHAEENRVGEFQTSLEQYLATEYLEAGKKALDKSDPDLAVELLSNSIRLKSSKDAHRWRAKAYRELGESDKAKRDEAVNSVSS